LILHKLQIISSLEFQSVLAGDGLGGEIERNCGFAARV